MRHVCSYWAEGWRQDHGYGQGTYHVGVARWLGIFLKGLQTIGLSGECVAVSLEWVRVGGWCSGCLRGVCMLSYQSGGGQRGG